MEVHAGRASAPGVTAYAGGPAELAYFAQAQVLFAHFGILPPVAYPRASVLLLERSIERLVERTGFTLADMARPQEELATEVGRRAMPEEIEATLAGLGRSVTEGYGALIELAASVDPTLQGALGRLRNEILARIGDSERRLVRAVKSRQTITLEQLERARANLYPLNQPQERVLNVFPFLARYGPELLERIAEAIEVPFGRRNEAEPVEARAANRAAG